MSDNPLPRLAIGSWPILAACQRRLALALDPDMRTTYINRDARFRMSNAVAEAIRQGWIVAHQSRIDFADAVGMSPPGDLEPEEAYWFTQAIEAYTDAVADRSGELHPDSGNNLHRPSGTGRFALSGCPDVILRRADGTLEAHRISWSANPRADDRLEEWATAVALLLHAPLPFEVVQVGVVSGGMPDLISIDNAQTTAFGRHLRDTVLGAVGLADPPPTPGWYCNECPYLAGCPTIPQVPAAEVIG